MEKMQRLAIDDMKRKEHLQQAAKVIEDLISSNFVLWLFVLLNFALLYTNRINSIRSLRSNQA